jgi:hypothetical protein
VIEWIFQIKTHGIPGGSGLGLSISRELSQLMGGTIEYSPRDDGETGSVFTLTLPFDVPSAVQDENDSPASSMNEIKYAVIAILSMVLFFHVPFSST